MTEVMVIMLGVLLLVIASLTYLVSSLTDPLLRFVFSGTLVFVIVITLLTGVGVIVNVLRSDP